jgi:hypothetical protein
MQSLPLIVIVLILAGCGGHGGGTKASATDSNAPVVALTENDIPDVLMPGVWPASANLQATRRGNVITVTSDWTAGETTVDGRDVTDAAQSICGVIVGDIGETGLSISVLAADGSALASKGTGDDSCHAG